MEINKVVCMDNLEYTESLPSESVDLIYGDILYGTGKKFKDYDDKLGTPQQAIEWYRPRLIEMYRVLKETGSIYLQCDYRLIHYLKVEMDKIFEYDNFRNEIVWLRSNSGKTTSKSFPNDTDSILFYSKSKDYILNKVFKPLSENTKKMYNKNDNDGRGKYRLLPMQKTSTPTKGTVYNYIDNNNKEWKCPKKGWRMINDKLKKLENDNRLILTGNNLSEKGY